MTDIRILNVPLFDLLTVLARSEDYGQDNPVFMSKVAQMTGPVSDEEIQSFADTFRTDEMKAHGVTETDALDMADRVNRWRTRYLAV